MSGQRKAYREDKRGGGMKRSLKIYEKRKLWKLLRAVGSKDKYLDAKRKSRHAVYTAERNTEKEKFASVKGNKNIFCITKQIQTENQDVIGEKCIGGDDGSLSLGDASKMLNTEFLWSQNLPHVHSVDGPAQFITAGDILKSLRCKKNGKAAGPSGFCCRNVESCS